MRLTYSKAFGNARRVDKSKLLRSALLITAAFGMGNQGCHTWGDGTQAAWSSCNNLGGPMFCQCMGSVLQNWIITRQKAGDIDDTTAASWSKKDSSCTSDCMNHALTSDIPPQAVPGTTLVTWWG
jgi:hypothetical protein